MKNTNDIKGITLITLVITIVVLITLSGITIKMITGQDGIVKNTQMAKESTELAMIKDEVQTLWLEVQQENIKSNKSPEELGELLEGKLRENDSEATVTYKEEYETYEIFYKGYNMELDGDGTIRTGDSIGSKKKIITVSSSDYSGIYDGEEHTITLDIIKPSSGTTIYYSTSTSLGESNYDTSGSTAKPGRTDIGTTTVYWYIKSNDSKYADKRGRNKITINNKNDQPIIGDKDDITADNSGANKPDVSKIAQKTYVTWDLNDTKTEYIINDTQTTPPSDWYDYDNGKWANIKTTNKVSDTETLEAYWVWIPRYEYIVPTSKTATEIEVKFIPTKKQADSGYTIHPAFTNEGNGGFGDLDGIWVAKYEAVNTTGVGEDTTDLKVQIKPNKASWRYISVNNAFAVCRKMTDKGEVLEGGTVDSHLMKNTEWGACAILSQSKYGIFNPESSTGKNGDKTYQVWNNPNGGVTCSVGTSKDSKSISEVDKSNPKNITKTSTTGTMYGIFDMAGCSWEFVAGCLRGTETAFGITEEKDKKYVDLYNNPAASPSNYDGAIIGDATKETFNWNDDLSTSFVSSYRGNYFFERGRILCGFDYGRGFCF